MKTRFLHQMILLLLFHCPGSVKGEWKIWTCPSFKFMTPTSMPVFRTGILASVTIGIEETPGDCNGMAKYPYERWYWEVAGNVTPTSGQGQTAMFTNWSKGQGTVNFELVCRSTTCPDCNAEYKEPVNFCVEDGPYYSSWSCIREATMSLRSIKVTPAVACLGDTISVAATLSKTTGLKKQAISYDCRLSIETTNSESVSVKKGFSITGPCMTNGSGLSCTFIPTNSGVGTITLWAQQDDTNSACSIDPYYVTQTATYTVLKTDLVGHQPGKLSKPGLEISEENEDDAENFQISVNDDNDDEIAGSHQDNQDFVIGDKDDDVVAVTLKPIEPRMQSGTMTLAVYPADGIRVYKADGEDLLSDYSVDLASPQGDLSALVSAPVTLYIEGMKTADDVALSLTYADGNVSCEDVLHLQVMQVDLDVDSDNENEFNAAGWDDDEDQEEDDETLPGKYIGVNDGDEDRDGIPNFADGYDLWDAGPGAGGAFTPMRLELKEPIDLETAKIKFIYSCSDPKGVVMTPAATPADSDQYVPASGHLRIWKRDGTENRKMAEVNDEGDFVKSGQQYDATDLGYESGRSIVFYVEGIAPSEKMGDQQIRVEVVPDPEKSLICRDVVRCTLLKAELVPDWNHDRVIDERDFNRATFKNPYRFWINDDTDNGDIASGNSDLPGNCDGNASDGEVNGRCDLLDFFPVWMNLGNLIKLIPSEYKCIYFLRNSNGTLNYFQSELSRQKAGEYLIKDSRSYGVDFIEYADRVANINVTADGASVCNSLYWAMKRNADEGVLILEGKTPTTSPLILEIHKDGPTGPLLYETQLPLSLSGVDEMYRWINLRPGRSGDSRTGPSPNFPDDQSNGKHVVFVHGYNINEDQGHATAAEVFKRLYWSGSRAMFTAVTWQGDEQGGLLDSGAYYHLDVINAFEAASNLVPQVAALPGGSKYIMAHSLGNMLVSSAIRDHGLSVSNYFMIDAAVPIEAYSSIQLSMDEMYPPAWAGYSTNLWASEWHRLWAFNPADGRNKLTWKNRFGDILNAVNYYSSSEDVLQNNPPNPPDPESLVGLWKAGQHVWCFQEMIKGGPIPNILWGVDSHGGWGFNFFYQKGGQPPDPNYVNGLSDETLRGDSVFKLFYDLNLHYSALGSALATNLAVRAKLLAEAIPAVSRATGRNQVDNRFGTSANNKDLVEFKTAGMTWPRNDDRWRHSDFKEVAYSLNFGLYDDIRDRGGLK